MPVCGGRGRFDDHVSIFRHLFGVTLHVCWGAQRIKGLMALQELWFMVPITIVTGAYRPTYN